MGFVTSRAESAASQAVCRLGNAVRVMTRLHVCLMKSLRSSNRLATRLPISRGESAGRTGPLLVASPALTGKVFCPLSFRALLKPARYLLATEMENAKGTMRSREYLPCILNVPTWANEAKAWACAPSMPKR